MLLIKIKVFFWHKSSNIDSNDISGLMSHDSWPPVITVHCTYYVWLYWEIVFGKYIQHFHPSGSCALRIKNQNINSLVFGMCVCVCVCTFSQFGVRPSVLDTIKALKAKCIHYAKQNFKINYFKCAWENDIKWYCMITFVLYCVMLC